MKTCWELVNVDHHMSLSRKRTNLQGSGPDIVNPICPRLDTCLVLSSKGRTSIAVRSRKSMTPSLYAVDITVLRLSCWISIMIFSLRTSLNLLRLTSD